MAELEVLNVSARFLNVYGYVGVALLLGLCAWYFRRRNVATFWITGSFALAFLVIFSALDLISRHFPQLIVSRPPLLIGRVANVGQESRITLVGGGGVGVRPFVRRENDANDAGLVQHRFIFPGRKFQCLLLAVSLPERSESKYYSVPIPMIAGLLPDDELYIRLRPHTGPDGAQGWNVTWIRQEQETIGGAQWAKELETTETDCQPPSADPTKDQAPRAANPFSLIATAIAQGVGPSAKGSSSPESVARLLESDDPFVRRDARLGLATYGQAAEPTLRRLLASGVYRQQIGALEAINAMRPDARRRLGADVWRQVQVLAANPDTEMRQSAQRAMNAR
jgi:hypothetical protein